MDANKPIADENIRRLPTQPPIESFSSNLLQGMADLSAAFGGEVIDPFAVYRRVQADGPVLHGDLLSVFGMKSMAASSSARPIYTLFRYDDVLAVLRDGTTFTSSINSERMGFLFDDLMLLGMDGEGHRLMRAALQPAFSPGVVARWRDDLIQPMVTREYVEPLLPRLACDLMADFAVGFPVRSVYQIIGMPDDPIAYAQFATWGLHILAAPTGDADRDPEGALTIRKAAIVASKSMYDHLRPIIAERRRTRQFYGDDLISSLLRADYGGRALDDHEIACFLRTVLPAAAESTTRTFCNLVLMLLKEPALLKEVRQDRGLIASAIDEAVRLEPVISVITREAQADVTLSQTFIAKGSALLLCVAAAGRDPDAYEDPDRFDLHRARRPSLGFGFGPHMCIGMSVAKIEMEVALNALLDAMPRLRLNPDSPPPLLTGVLFRGPDRLPVRWD
jgi:cytochrome P450